MVEADREPLRTVGSELIVGGQKSGKSRRALSLAQCWLAGAPGRRAVLIATARASDDEMQERIRRHQCDRSQQVPAMLTVEEPIEVAAAIGHHGGAGTLLVVDCLTLWLSNLLWPDHADPAPAAPVLTAPSAATTALLQAISAARGPIVLVSNEIGLGVVPIGPGVRAFVDALGQLNQQVARGCERVTLMAAGLPLVLKGAP